MKMKMFMVLFLVSLVLTACGSYKALTDVREDLLNTIKEYNEMVRLKEFDKAKLFVAESTREEFDVRAKATKDVKFEGYRILSRDFITATDKEIVKVEFDYAISPLTPKKTLIDNQTWSFLYVKEEGRKRWRLLTPLPEFN